MTDTSKPTAGKSRPTSRDRRLVLAAFACSGAAALIYEVVWTRQLSLVFGSTVYAVSLMLGAFMSGLSLGSFLFGKRADRSKTPIALFGMLELGIGAFGLLTIPLIRLTPAIYFLAYNNMSGSLGVVLFVQLVISFLIMLVPTTLMGATFPVVSKINTMSIQELGEDVGTVYSVNTLGSIAGSLGAGFLLIPLFGVRSTTLTAAAVNLAVGAAMIWVGRKGRLGPSGVGLIGVFAIALATAVFTPASAAMLTLEMRPIAGVVTLSDFLEYKSAYRTLYYEETAEGPVSVLQTPEGDLQLRNCGATEGADVLRDQQTMRLQALIPLSVRTDAESIVIVGLGTGGTTLEALRAAGPDATVDTIEINPAVLEASTYFVGDAIESDPRSAVHVGDARSFLRYANRQWDVITSEPSYPLSSSVTALFTKDFFEIARDRLADDGVICQWFPAYLLGNNDLLMLLKTFRSVFPNTYVFLDRAANGGVVDVFALARKDAGAIDPDTVVAGVLQAAGQDFAFEVYATPDELDDLTASDSIPINTDDRPYLEFRTPRNHIKALWQ